VSNRWKIELQIAVALGLAASAGFGVAGPAGTGDKAQIEALEATFASGFNAKDVGKIMSCYAHDGLFVFDIAPPRQHVGWEDYKKDWESLFGGMPGSVTFKIMDLDVTAVGSVAYSHSVQSVRWTAAGGAKVELTARVTDVYRKTAGEWRIVQEHVSVPVDLDTGKGDLMSKP
jgi:uncharacterized protein (TIGR02246 family)